MMEFMKHELPRFRRPRTTPARLPTFPFESLDEPLLRLREELREPRLIPEELSCNRESDGFHEWTSIDQTEHGGPLRWQC